MFKKITGIWLLFFISTSLMGFEIKPYQLELQAKRFGRIDITISGSQSLKPVSGNHWLYTLTTNSSFFKILEKSQFIWQNDAVTPIKFESSSRIAFVRNNESIVFDRHDEKIRVERKKGHSTYKYLPKIMDPSSFQVKLMHELGEGKKHFTYSIQELKRQTEYIFNVTGQSWFKTPMGYLKVLKLEQNILNRPNENKYYWVAEEFGFIPVLIETHVNGKIESQVKVISGRYNGIEIKGSKTRPE